MVEIQTIPKTPHSGLGNRKIRSEGGCYANGGFRNRYIRSRYANGGCENRYLRSQYANVSCGNQYIRSSYANGPGEFQLTPQNGYFEATPNTRFRFDGNRNQYAPRPYCDDQIPCRFAHQNALPPVQLSEYRKFTPFPQSENRKYAPLKPSKNGSQRSEFNVTENV